MVVSVSASGEEDTSAPPSSWPSHQQLDAVRKRVAQMSQRISAGEGEGEVSVVASPYRICPLGAHIDHQGGVVTAMTINYGVLLAFVPSQDGQIVLQSGQFQGELRFNSKDSQTPITNPENISWESYARGAVYALQSSGYDLHKGIIGFISGVEGLDSSGLSSSAAVGIAYLLALEYANKIIIPPLDNINLDKYPPPCTTFTPFSFSNEKKSDDTRSEEECSRFLTSAGAAFSQSQSQSQLSLLLLAIFVLTMHLHHPKG